MQQRLRQVSILVCPAADFVGGASSLDRRCNKPVSLTSPAAGANLLDESSNQPETDLSFFPADRMLTQLLPLRVASLSAKIAPLLHLTSVHERFLERGQEVSHDLLLMSRRNFS